MDWIVDFSQKIATSLDTEGVMTMHEDAFDFVQNQFQTIGNTIENGFQAICADIEGYCSIFNSDVPNSKSVYIENENMEPTGPESCFRSLDLNLPDQEKSKSDVGDSKLIHLEDEHVFNSKKGFRNTRDIVVDSEEKDTKSSYAKNENIKPTAQGSSELGRSFRLPDNLDDVLKPNEYLEEFGRRKYVQCVEEHIFNSRKGFEKTCDSVVSSVEKDANSSYTINENVEPTAQEISVLGRSYTLPDNLDDALMPSEFLEEFRSRKYVQYVDDSDSEDFVDGRYVEEDIEETQVDSIEETQVDNIAETKVDNICARDDYKQCSLCLNKFKSHPVIKRKLSEACDLTMRKLALQEWEQPAPDSEIPDLEDESLDWDWDSDFEFCDSDWQII